VGSATSIIIDCDPGHDDAIALLLALASPELRLLGVTTVSGNQSLSRTTANAIRVLDHVGRADIPVAAGPGRRRFMVRRAWTDRICRGPPAIPRPSTRSTG
jgi:inosine-uridine nucleoside N-ribohydrolase